MNEIRPIGPSGAATGNSARVASRSPGPGVDEPHRSQAGSAAGAGTMRGPRYAEIAELQRLQAKLDRQQVGVRVPPHGSLLEDLAGHGRPDPTFPHPAAIPGDNRPMGLARLQGTLRSFLAELPAGREGPRSEMNAVLRAWCDSRNRLTSRLGRRG